MSADNYYLVDIHPLGGYAVEMGFESWDHEVEVIESSMRFNTLEEAQDYACAEYSEYGVRVSGRAQTQGLREQIAKEISSGSEIKTIMVDALHAQFTGRGWTADYEEMLANKLYSILSHRVSIAIANGPLNSLQESVIRNEGETSTEAVKPYPTDLFPGCPCFACFPGFPNGLGGFNRAMNLCPTCGNKRCPSATDHTNACSHSNDPKVNDAAWEVIRLERGMAFCSCTHALHKGRAPLEGEDPVSHGCKSWVNVAGELCPSCAANTCEGMFRAMREVGIL